MTRLTEGSDCPLGEGVCAADGHCVDCLDQTHCDGLACDDGFCVAQHCMNGAQDADEGETGQDCGGECKPCPAGVGCVVGTDCASGFCAADMTCGGCTSDGDCGNFFCNESGVCEAEREDGTFCDGPNQCQSSACPPEDSVCCAEACDGECVSCLNRDTGQPTGTCHPVLAGTDPSGECLLGGPLLKCNGAGKCTVGGN